MIKSGLLLSSTSYTLLEKVKDLQGLKIKQDTFLKRIKKLYFKMVGFKPKHSFPKC